MAFTYVSFIGRRALGQLTAFGSGEVVGRQAVAIGQGDHRLHVDTDHVVARADDQGTGDESPRVGDVERDRWPSERRIDGGLAER
jgi:hypothetical protein